VEKRIFPIGIWPIYITVPCATALVCDKNYHYSINNTELENIESIKDLGVTFDSRL